MKTSSRLVNDVPFRHWRVFSAGVLFAATLSGTSALGIDAPAQEIEQQRAAEHPLDRALQRAKEGLTLIEDTVSDYTATIIKRERIGGKLREHQFISAKIRNRKVKDGQVVVPFGVYLKFLKPDSIAGREVIWVENANENKVVVHETGLLGFKRFHLPPDGLLAMMGQRYPITNIGIQKLIEELIVRGEHDLKYDECEVKFYKGAKVDEYVCTLIEVLHPVKRDHFSFYRARIYIEFPSKGQLIDWAKKIM